MAAAHRLNIVHRDLKPDNIAVLRDASRRDYVKVFINERRYLPDASRRRIGRKGRRIERCFEDVIQAGIEDGSIRADTDGNIWAGMGWVGAGYDGVHIFDPEGQRIGMILLPEICANICFGGAKRNRLFMAASQSLYSVYVGTQGAHIA